MGRNKRVSWSFSFQKLLFMATYVHSRRKNGFFGNWKGEWGGFFPGPIGERFFLPRLVLSRPMANLFFGFFLFRRGR